MESKSQDRELRLLERRIQDLDNPRELYHSLEQIKRTRSLTNEEFKAQIRAMNDLGKLTNEAAALARVLGFLPSLGEDSEEDRFVLGDNCLEEIDSYWSEQLVGASNQTSNLNVYLPFFALELVLPIWEKSYKAAVSKQCCLTDGFSNFEREEPDIDEFVDWGANEWSEGEDECQSGILNIDGQQYQLNQNNNEAWHDLVIDLECNLSLKTLIETLRAALMCGCKGEHQRLKRLFSSYQKDKVALWLAKEGLFDHWDDFSRPDFDEYPDWANAYQSATLLTRSILGGRDVSFENLDREWMFSFIYSHSPDEYSLESAIEAQLSQDIRSRKENLALLEQQIFTQLMNLAINRPELLFPGRGFPHPPCLHPVIEERYQEGDRVRIKEGSFENFRGEILKIDSKKEMAGVSLKLFGRPTTIQFELWKIESIDIDY